VKGIVGWLFVASLAVACTIRPAPSSSPSAATPTSSEPPPPASPADDPLQGARGELLVAHLIEDPDPYFDVRVDAVRSDGAWQPVATIDDVIPAGWEAAAPVFDSPVSIGPSGYLLLLVERHGGVNATDRRTLLIDLRNPERRAVEIDDHLYGATWGPDGRLSWSDGEAIRWLDPTLGNPVRIESVPYPPGVSHGGLPARDGSGWVTGRNDENEERLDVGILTADGRFVPGLRPAFVLHGVERRFGAAGGGLSIAVSDGIPTSEVVVAEYRPDLPGNCHCIVWVRQVDPSDDPTFGEAFWDAGGTGVWVLMAARDGEARWLSHVTTPAVDAPVADLPAGAEWQIVGVSDDDRWVVLAAAQQRHLALTDTTTGATTIVAWAVGGEGSVGPRFAGWIR